MPSYTQRIKKLRGKSEISPFTIATNNIKYLGVTLTKEVKDLFYKNLKSLKKETEENIRTQKDLPFSWIGNLLN